VASRSRAGVDRDHAGAIDREQLGQVQPRALVAGIQGQRLAQRGLGADEIGAGEVQAPGLVVAQHMPEDRPAVGGAGLGLGAGGGGAARGQAHAGRQVGQGELAVVERLAGMERDEPLALGDRRRRLAVGEEAGGVARDHQAQSVELAEALDRRPGGAQLVGGDPPLAGVELDLDRVEVAGPRVGRRQGHRPELADLGRRQRLRRVARGQAQAVLDLIAVRRGPHVVDRALRDRGLDLVVVRREGVGQLGQGVVAAQVHPDLIALGERQAAALGLDRQRERRGDVVGVGVREPDEPPAVLAVDVAAQRVLEVGARGAADPAALVVGEDPGLGRGLDHPRAVELGQVVVADLADQVVGRAAARRRDQGAHAGAGDQRSSALIAHRELADRQQVLGGVDPQVLAGDDDPDDRVVEAALAGQGRVDVPARAGRQERDVGGEAGAAQERDEERRLVLAVAEPAGQGLARRGRDHRRVAELDAGVADLGVEPGDDAGDGGAVAWPGQLGRQLDRLGQLGLDQPAVVGGDRGPARAGGEADQRVHHQIRRRRRRRLGPRRGAAEVPAQLRAIADLAPVRLGQARAAGHQGDRPGGRVTDRQRVARDRLVAVDALPRHRAGR
jgi:hypothetical protein